MMYNRKVVSASVTPQLKNSIDNLQKYYAKELTTSQHMNLMIHYALQNKEDFLRFVNESISQEDIDFTLLQKATL